MEKEYTVRRLKKKVRIQSTDSVNGWEDKTVTPIQIAFTAVRRAGKKTRSVQVASHKYTYLETIVFILVIAAIVQLLEIILKKFLPPIYKSLGIYLPLITTNCAVLGITMLNITDGLNFVQSLFNALGAGLGFMLAMLLFSGVRERLETADIPEFLKGLPITLVSAAIVALSFLGFAGIGG